MKKRPYYIRFIRIKILKKLKRIIKKRLYSIIMIDSNVHSISLGFAIGVFVGMFPIVGQMFLALLIASIFRVNTFAAVSAVWISNPLTYVPLFFFNYWVGSLFFDPSHVLVLEDFSEIIIHLNYHYLFSKGPDVLYSLFLGCFITAIVSAILTYFISRRIISLIMPLIKKRKKLLK